MDTAFSRATGIAPGTASLVGSLQYISDTRPRPHRATSSRIREARWCPRHTLITQDHHDASEAVTAFQLSSMEWRAAFERTYPSSQAIVESGGGCSF
jgi:hypothetical protein